MDIDEDDEPPLNEIKIANMENDYDENSICVKCAIGTKDKFYIICELCGNSTHVECVVQNRFSDHGTYRCENCNPPEKVANTKIYVSLNSELAYFIANYLVSETVSYGVIVNKSCEISEWPKENEQEKLAYKIADEQGKSLFCSQCKKNIAHDKAFICKGCLSVTHAECCYNLNSTEKTCEICQARHTVKLKLRDVCVYSSHTKLDCDKREGVKRTSKFTASNIRENYDESEDERNLLRRATNVTPLATSSPHVLNDRNVSDQLNRIQLNQLLHMNLPPLFKFSQWDNFYKAYEETKHYFSDSQNVHRIQNAIKCKVVKKWGKERLFDYNTYDERIQYINKTYNLPDIILDMEFEKLIQRRRIARHERIRLAEFINDVDDYCALQIRRGTEASRRDIKMIRSIIKILPWDIGEDYVNYIYEKSHRVLCIESLNKFLQKRIHGIIWNNPEILALGYNADKRKANEKNSQKRKRKFLNYYSNVESTTKCDSCEKEEHIILKCEQACERSANRENTNENLKFENNSNECVNEVENNFDASNYMHRKASYDTDKMELNEKYFDNAEGKHFNLVKVKNELIKCHSRDTFQKLTNKVEKVNPYNCNSGKITINENKILSEKSAKYFESKLIKRSLRVCHAIGKILSGIANKIDSKSIKFDGKLKAGITRLKEIKRKYLKHKTTFVDFKSQHHTNHDKNTTTLKPTAKLTVNSTMMMELLKEVLVNPSTCGKTRRENQRRRKLDGFSLDTG